MTDAGMEWLVEAEGCCPETLRSLRKIQMLLQRIVGDLRLNVIGAGQWHQFPAPGAGITGLLLLSESHLACHTFPETQLATINLYCCRDHGVWPWEARLKELLQAERVIVRTARRGAQISPSVLLPVQPRGKRKKDARKAG